MRSYLLNSLGTRSEPHNPSFTVARPQLNLGQPHPCTLSVRGLWLQRKTIQHGLKHEKPPDCKGECSFVKFAEGETDGHGIFSVPSAFPVRPQAHWFVLLPTSSPDHNPISPRSYFVLWLRVGERLLCKGSLLSELDSCSCVALDKLILLSALHPQ